ncbi:MAG: TIGR04282 family arsenosugar biosynthesis glycosyltransferase [Verrucomicrobiota bacterium]
MKRGTAVFLKYPEPGKVKTRLAKSIGAESSASAFRVMVGRVFENLRQAQPDFVAVVYDPPDQEQQIRSWLEPWLSTFAGEVLLIPQAPGDLGARLEAGIARCFEHFPDAALTVTGADCIEIEPEIYGGAWAELETGADAVYGPTDDGGYYLVGLKRPIPELFQNVPWSVEETLQASLDVAREAGLAIELLPQCSDIDTVREWEAAQEKLAARPALFFDRDGVVNESPGPGYVLDLESFHLQEGIGESIALLHDCGWLAILVTSQRGVGKGLMSSQELHNIHREMQRELEEIGGAFDGIYAFTDLPDCSYAAKPDPAMIEAAISDFGIDRSRSWMIGDADRDIKMAQLAGLAGTIRVVGEKAVGIEADCNLTEISELPELLQNILQF